MHEVLAVSVMVTSKTQISSVCLFYHFLVGIFFLIGWLDTSWSQYMCMQNQSAPLSAEGTIMYSVLEKSDF